MDTATSFVPSAADTTDRHDHWGTVLLVQVAPLAPPQRAGNTRRGWRLGDGLTSRNLGAGDAGPASSGLVGAGTIPRTLAVVCAGVVCRMAKVAVTTTLAAPTGHLRRSCITVRSCITLHGAHSHTTVELAGRAVAPRAAVVIDATVAVDQAPVAVGTRRRVTTLAGHVARAVRVLETLVVRTHHVAASELKTPSVDAGGAVRVLLTVSPWRWPSVGSAHCRNPSRRSVVRAGWAWRSAVVCGNARFAGLAAGRAIHGAGGTVSDVVVGIDLATGKAIHGASGAVSDMGVGIERGARSTGRSPSACYEGERACCHARVNRTSHTHTIHPRAVAIYERTPGVPLVRVRSTGTAGP